MTSTIRYAGLLAAALMTPLAAHAGLSFSQTLNQFNVVVLQDAQIDSHVDGRTYIGGNLTGGGDFAQHPADAPASDYLGLTVAGNATFGHVNGLGVYVGGNMNGTVNTGPTRVVGNASGNINGSTPAAIGGTFSGGNLNAGQLSGAAATTALNDATAIANSTNFGTVLNQGSSFLAGLADTGGSVVFNGGKVTFTAAPVGGVAVFNLNSIDDSVFAAGEFDFNLNGANTVVFNSDNTNINLHANFLGGGAQKFGGKLLWNFYNATNIVVNSQFGGAIIGTKAHLIDMANIEGSVAVWSMYQNAEIHLAPYTGTIVTAVPEPGTYAMMAVGLGLIGYQVARRRNKRQGRA